MHKDPLIRARVWAFESNSFGLLHHLPGHISHTQVVQTLPAPRSRGFLVFPHVVSNLGEEVDGFRLQLQLLIEFSLRRGRACVFNLFLRVEEVFTAAPTLLPQRRNVVLASTGRGTLEE